jgi:hypothetical protein
MLDFLLYKGNPNAIYNRFSYSLRSRYLDLTAVLTNSLSKQIRKTGHLTGYPTGHPPIPLPNYFVK